MQRNRLAYTALIAVVIAAGLASRSEWARHLPEFIASYAGDTLWALVVFLALGFVFRTLSTTIVAAVAIAIAFAVEFSQLYRGEWLNRLRDTRIGGLLLGEGFLWSDLVCYSVGVLIGVAGEVLWSRRRK